MPSYYTISQGCQSLRYMFIVFKDKSSSLLSHKGKWMPPLSYLSLIDIYSTFLPSMTPTLCYCSFTIILILNNSTPTSSWYPSPTTVPPLGTSKPITQQPSCILPSFSYLLYHSTIRKKEKRNQFLMLYYYHCAAGHHSLSVVPLSISMKPPSYCYHTSFILSYSILYKYGGININHSDILV